MEQLGRWVADWKHMEESSRLCKSSGWCNVLSGNLGSMLFIIFINDMHDKITSMIHLFADDTKTNPMTSRITLPD